MKAILNECLKLAARNYGTRVSPLEAGKLVLQARKQDADSISSLEKKSIILDGKKSESRSSRQRIANLAEELYDNYNPGYSRTGKSHLGTANYFFNAAEVTYEWSASSFWEIPGEKLKARAEQQTLDQKHTFQISGDLAHTNGSVKKYLGKTDGIPFELLNGLPEVAFLGRCNAGKSTLLNNLTTEFSKLKLDEYAKTSKKAGYTKTINSFNVGRRFRLIDTPGYGVRGTHEQGELIMRYLRERRELKRAFLLISAEQGFTETDSQVIEFLTKFGIPFELVFTKLDKVKNVGKLHQIIQESGVLELPTMPRMLFLNSVTNSSFPKRLGISSLRNAILESCGLEEGVRPLKIKSK
ncbi:LAME_0G18646g1_1 [Lachancea meyersii CBS 8951]|uniref:LAME_0G18646g1_1 n=1 Tax=Lachancea meyersii CBS 8951 TaxID=1266667 RepID=A0A1G4KBW4_9SACH|nr:LAME_0G18646g1_1 [Lachancea meyersii CBS 8951]